MKQQSKDVLFLWMMEKKPQKDLLRVNVTNPAISFFSYAVWTFK